MSPDPKFVADNIKFVNKGTGAIKESVTVFCQTEATCRAQEQSYAQMFFQLGNQTTDTGG